MSRRQARELALQVLFQSDLGQTDPKTALFQSLHRDPEGDRNPLSEKDIIFASDLAEGTWERLVEIDKLILQYAKDWTVDRMAVVDRNILRLAIYEINHQADIPDSVAVDEAVELAKQYSTAESGKFINGILGSYIRGLQPTVTEHAPLPLPKP